MPTLEASTLPVTEIELVRSPSKSSVAVAPGSVQFSPIFNCMVDEPLSVIIGGVMSIS